jgi:hypothetical protein
MDNLERDYASLLEARHDLPCLSLYQPTHRTHPEKQQDLVRFRNLVRNLELQLEADYDAQNVSSALRPFHELAGNTRFWNSPLDGLAVFGAPQFFGIYRIQRTVPELVVVASSFHTTPLTRILQSADRYQILGINREEACLFEGNRYVLDAVELPPAIPRRLTDVVGDKEGSPEQKKRVYGPEGRGATGHGTNVRQKEQDAEVERFFRAVDAAILEHYSRASKMPLILSALPEHHHLFRTVTRNPFLISDSIGVYAGAISTDQLRERAWQLILPHYLSRLSDIIARFEVAKANALGSEDVTEVAKAAAAGRISTMLIDADSRITGHFDPESGAAQLDRQHGAASSELLDDLGEHVIRTGGEVVIVPTEQMPTNTGLAAIFRY